jgi:hypothetical protein
MMYSDTALSHYDDSTMHCNCEYSVNTFYVQIYDIEPHYILVYKTEAFYRYFLRLIFNFRFSIEFHMSLRVNSLSLHSLGGMSAVASLIN